MEMSTTRRQHQRSSRQKSGIGTAEAFYQVFRVLPKKDRLTVARYIIEDEEIRSSYNLGEAPNELTLKAFAEDKAGMPSFHSMDELRKDLLS